MYQLNLANLTPYVKSQEDHRGLQINATVT